MAHETRTQPDGTWITGYQIPRADFEDLDAKQFRGINGDRGGAYAPTAPIVIGGAGLACTGPLSIRGAGALTIAGSATVVLGDDDYPELAEGHAGRSRVLLQSTLPFMTVGGYPWAVSVSRTFAGAQPIALTLRDSGGVDRAPEFLCNLRVHDGATLEKVVFTFRVPEKRGAAPATMPQFRVFRRDVNGKVEPLQATVLGDGYASPENPGSAELWFKNGAAQSFEYVCDQNNVIDVSKYVYFAHVIEETGATAFPGMMPVFTALPIALASTADAAGATGNTTLDGAHAIGAGPTSVASPVLLKDNTLTATNGVYNGDPGGTLGNAVVRSTTLDDSTEWVHGTLFPIVEGDSQSATVWQATVPTPFVLGTSPLLFAQPTPRGNVYCSIELHCSGIVDTRPQ